MKIGLWHEGIKGAPSSSISDFKSYTTSYINFCHTSSIDKAFFLLSNPNIKAGTYVNKGWLEEYWLNKLPTTTEAGLVLDTEPNYPWSQSPIYTTGDSMDLAIKLVSDINTNPNNTKQITSIAFDSENVNSKLSGSYDSVDGVKWIEDRLLHYNLTNTVDYGFAGQKHNTKYPEVYWVDELKKCGCTGATINKSQCECPNTPYCKYNGDTTALLSGSIGTYLNNNTWLANPNIWPMFSLERSSNIDCIASNYSKGNVCGVFDGFGVWTKTDFMKFLDQVENKYGIKQVMLYEFQFIPNDWLKNNKPIKINKPKVMKVIKKFLTFIVTLFKQSKFIPKKPSTYNKVYSKEYYKTHKEDKLNYSRDYYMQNKIAKLSNNKVVKDLF
jgi:hypothetical protein